MNLNEISQTCGILHLKFPTFRPFRNKHSYQSDYCKRKRHVENTNCRQNKTEKYYYILYHYVVFVLKDCELISHAHNVMYTASIGTANDLVPSTTANR